MKNRPLPRIVYYPQEKTMKNKSRTPELNEMVRIAHRKLLEWEESIKPLKKLIPQHIETIGWKKTAAILQYNAAVKIARLGASLLEKSMENREEGLLHGLTKRPLFESYTRGIWFEYVADEKQAEDFLLRSKKDEENKYMTLRSEKATPSLEKMWNALQKKEGVIRDMVKWIRKRKDWWNDSTHVTARSVQMGWSNEYGEAIQKDKYMKDGLTAFLEIGAQCAGHIHVLIEGNYAMEERIHQEKLKLRGIIEADLDP